MDLPARSEPLTPAPPPRVKFRSADPLGAEFCTPIDKPVLPPVMIVDATGVRLPTVAVAKCWRSNSVALATSL